VVFQGSIEQSDENASRIVTVLWLARDAHAVPGIWDGAHDTRAAPMSRSR
jgi:hypothetical protein